MSATATWACGPTRRRVATAHTHGTYINGFHETWEIKHAENAVGFAKVGQTIVNVPDAKLVKLYVDDEPLLLARADLEEYERSIDFRTGVCSPAISCGGPRRAKRVRVSARPGWCRWWTDTSPCSPTR